MFLVHALLFRDIIIVSISIIMHCINLKLERFNDVKNDSYVSDSRSVKRMLTFSCMHASTVNFSGNYCITL